MIDLDLGKLVEIPDKSNPMIIALGYPNCPLGYVCFYVAAGSGIVAQRCAHIHTSSPHEFLPENAKCDRK